MTSFEEVEAIAKQYALELSCGSRIDITPLERYELYQKFGELTSVSFSPPDIIFSDDESDGYSLAARHRILNLTTGDKTLSWLAVITAKKVSPIWDRIKGQIEVDFNLVLSPHDIIKVIEKFLLTSENIDEVQELSEENSNKPRWDWLVTLDVANSFDAAYMAFQLFYYGSNTLNSYFKAENGAIYDIRDDFVACAIDAYSIDDPHPPGAHLEAGAFLPVSFYRNKQIEFWQWWLLEAIPQAMGVRVWNIEERASF